MYITQPAIYDYNAGTVVPFGEVSFATYYYSSVISEENIVKYYKVSILDQEENQIQNHVINVNDYQIYTIYNVELDIDYEILGDSYIIKLQALDGDTLPISQTIMAPHTKTVIIGAI